MKFSRARVAGYFCVLFFWTISLSYLDRFPPINPDEPWILSPGYKLFSQGIYGSDLFAGFYRMERHYFEFMPLMSLVQGVGARFYGIGVFQMRFAPILFGAMILAVAFAIARDLKNEFVGLLAMLLLLFWQWTPSGDWMRASGIPLVDVSRIARYDILAALLGLAALWQFIRARETGKHLRDVVSGLFAGLAGLAHVYGLFWIVALVFVAIINRVRKNTLAPHSLSASFRGLTYVRRSAGVVLFLLGAIIAWLPWIAVIAMNWNDFVGQTMQDNANFDLLNPSFYFYNLINEGTRYSFGAESLFVFGALFALGFLLARVLFAHDRRALWLFFPTFVIPFLFALFLKTKLPNYLVTLAPLYAIGLAWGACQLWESRYLAARAAPAAFIAISVLYGANAIAIMQTRASQSASMQNFFAELDETIPPSARVLSHPQYWLARNSCDCRSFVLPFLFSNPNSTTAPISFHNAMQQIAPTIVLVDAEINQAFDERPTIREQFWSYVRERHGRILRELRDPEGNPILVYQLDTPQ